MARYRDAKCRLCRREGMKLFLKGARCFTDKCAIERRIDNVVHRLGFAASRREGRQMVAHGHFEVNGRKVSVPSYLVRVGDVVRARQTSKMLARVDENMNAGRGQVPQWLELDPNERKGVVRSFPLREDIQIPVSEQLIVELYSK